MTNSTSSTRSNRITLLVIFILGLALWNGLRFAETLVFWKTLQTYHAQPGPLYVAGSGAAWFLIGTMLLVGIWQGKTWAWYAAIGAATGYPVWFWADRLFLQQPSANWPFALAVTLTCLLIILIILFTPKTKQYFHLGKGNHERK